MNSLRLKIALAMAVLVLVATSVVGAISYRSTSARLIAEVDDSISQATTLLVRPGDDNRVRIPARGLLGIYSVRVLNVRAETVNSSFEVDLPVSDAARSVVGVNRGFDQSTVEFGSERFRVHTVGRDAGAVQVARSLGETDRVLRDVQRRTAFFVLVVSSLAAAVGWLLASTVAAPLRRLTRAASEVEQSGDLNVALPEPGRDEVGRLGSAFGSMLGALQRSRGEQQRLVQDAGHELRTPLTSLRTNLAVLRRHPDMEPDMQERILEDLDSEVGELTELVNELVAVASGELADQPPQDLLLAEVARRVAARVGRRRDRSVVVEVGEEASVFAPLAGIERAITNLIENDDGIDLSSWKSGCTSVRKPRCLRRSPESNGRSPISSRTPRSSIRAIPRSAWRLTGAGSRSSTMARAFQKTTSRWSLTDSTAPRHRGRCPVQGWGWRSCVRSSSGTVAL